MEIKAKADQCFVCVKSVSARQDAFECDTCGRWVHRACGTRYSHAEYLVITKQIRGGIPFSWSCDKCACPETVKSGSAPVKDAVSSPHPVHESTRLDVNEGHGINRPLEGPSIQLVYSILHLFVFHFNLSCSDYV
jgi:hypothetical protein